MSSKVRWSQCQPKISKEKIANWIITPSKSFRVVLPIKTLVRYFSCLFNALLPFTNFTVWNVCPRSAIVYFTKKLKTDFVLGKFFFFFENPTNKNKRPKLSFLGPSGFFVRTNMKFVELKGESFEQNFWEMKKLSFSEYQNYTRPLHFCMYWQFHLKKNLPTWFTIGCFWVGTGFVCTLQAF